MHFFGNPRVQPRFLAYVVTMLNGAQVTYQAHNAAHARRIAVGEGYSVQAVFRE